MQKKVNITNIQSDGRCSVQVLQSVDVEGVEHLINNTRVTLVPGQFEKAQELLPENLFAAIQAIWIPKVVAAYEAKITAIEEAMAPPVSPETVE